VKKATLEISIEGLRMACCERAVVKALKSIQGVEDVKIVKNGGSKVAKITLKEGGSLFLSTIREELDKVSRGKGCCCKDAEFKPKEDMIPADVIRRLMVKGSEKQEDQQKLLHSIKAVKGIKDIEIKVKSKDRIDVTFQWEDEQVGAEVLPTLKVLKKAIQKGGYTLSDVELMAIGEEKKEAEQKETPRKGCGCCGDH
jgi:copper chaperone CopZ